MSTAKFALLGHPLAHSMSPFLHQRLFAAAGVQASYELLDAAPEELPAAVERLREFDGFNITIPYKQSILPYLNEVDGTASFFGSVNTVKNEGGRLIGCSTDGDGFLFALRAAGVSCKGSLLLLGCGGASRAMGGTALLAGASSILVAARHPERAEPLLADLRSFARERGLSCEIRAQSFEELERGTQERWDLLVNGTPVGMHPHTDGCPVSEQVINRCKAVFDAVYNPDETVLLQTAERLGKTAVHGIGMLCGQAAVSEEFWGLPACDTDSLLRLCREAVEEMNRQFGEGA